MIQENEYIDDFEEEEEEEIFRYSITSYGADYTVDRLVSRLKSGRIIIPKFQRQYVWDIKQASRFIESLILGLPVPGVFFSQEKESNNMLVIDGQQRLLSLLKFFDKKFNNQLFKLKGVQRDLEGKSVDELSPKDLINLEDSVIHATVIKQDSPEDDESSIYMVFERLNTGGMKLAPQEIRACIYHGAFNECLSHLAEDEYWKQIYEVDNKRLKSEELILRYFALYDKWEVYKKGLKGFLNSYMEEHQNPAPEYLNEINQRFKKVIKVIFETIGNNAFRLATNINAAVFDSVMVGVTYRMEDNSIQIDSKKFKDAYECLINNKNYRLSVEKSTSSAQSVKERISLAIKAFAEI